MRRLFLVFGRTIISTRNIIVSRTPTMGLRMVQNQKNTAGVINHVFLLWMVPLMPIMMLTNLGKQMKEESAVLCRHFVLEWNDGFLFLVRYQYSASISLSAPRVLDATTLDFVHFWNTLFVSLQVAKVLSHK